MPIFQSPLERAAWAIWDGFGRPKGGWQRFIPTTQNMLRAIREIDLQTDHPVEVDMLCAGCAVLPEHDEPMQEDALNCWQAMIDALLADSPTNEMAGSIAANPQAPP